MSQPDSVRPHNRVPLPNAEWAELKTPAELTRGERRLLARHQVKVQELVMPKFEACGFTQAMALGEVQTPDEITLALGRALSADDLELLEDATGAKVVVFLKAWSKSEPLPTIDTLDDMLDGDYQALATATRTLSVGLVSGEPDEDPGSPTPPSAG